jgi:FMN-dependent NADH-azoreductase
VERGHPIPLETVYRHCPPARPPLGLDPATGYFGLLRNKKAVLAYTSGAYGPTAPSPAFGIDHHSTYLRDWLNQAGVTDIAEIRYQPTLLDPDSEAAFARAKTEAAALAA